MPIPDGSVPIGQRQGLSNLDVAKINKLYNCSKYLRAILPSAAPALHGELWARCCAADTRALLARLDSPPQWQTSPAAVSGNCHTPQRGRRKPLAKGGSSSLKAVLSPSTASLPSATRMLVRYVTTRLLISVQRYPRSQVNAGGSDNEARLL